eukprot:1156988-Pelagomonas_calceolata.AAC.1
MKLKHSSAQVSTSKASGGSAQESASWAFQVCGMLRHKQSSSKELPGSIPLSCCCPCPADSLTLMQHRLHWHMRVYVDTYLQSLKLSLFNCATYD